MRRWTEFVIAHRKAVMLIWLLVTVAGAAVSNPVMQKLTYDYSMPGQPGDRAADLVTEHLGNGGRNTPYVASLTFSDGNPSENSAAAAASFASIKDAVPGTRILDQANTGDQSLMTSDGHTAYALVFYPYDPSPTATPPTSAIRSALNANRPPGTSVGLTSQDMLASGSSSSGSGVWVETLIGAVGAILVLAYVFTSFIAVLPLVVAFASIMASFLALWPMTTMGTFSGLLQFLITLVGLGVAVDYTLLCVTRWREERSRGLENRQAVIEAMSTAGRAVLISGLTVGVGLLSLVVLPAPFLRSTGIGGALIPLLSVAAATSLTPALLATIGPRLDWPRHRARLDGDRRWRRWGRAVAERPLPAAAGAGAVLLALIAALFSINIGQTASTSLATSGAPYETLQLLEEGDVSSGVLTPIEIPTKSSQAESAAVQLEAVPHVRTVLRSTASDSTSDGLTVLVAVPDRETVDSSSIDVVRELQSVGSRTPGVTGVAGFGATQVDFVHAVYGHFPEMILIIAVLTFLLLARSFRSVLLPLKAVVLNLMSLAATCGGMVLFWQLGHGSNAVFNVPATGAITFWIPLIVFAFLFGLSMDYEVFILARMREEYDRSGSTKTAIAKGMGHTGRLVTSAALVLFLSFVAMASGPGTDLKVMATGLGFGILLDATIVRCLLLPALVAVMGRANWWWPSLLERTIGAGTSPTPSEASDSMMVRPDGKRARIR